MLTLGREHEMSAFTGTSFNHALPLWFQIYLQLQEIYHLSTFVRDYQTLLNHGPPSSGFV